ncbi:class I SAM-dependent methyltransferase [Pantoea sp. SS70]|uniref:class I SAM-dependent methyltransferase n=1 Tax=Pantoea sp. SS70 TaxID=3024247 RepID=UPI002452A5B8|nr:class I SAM-dependent methyltransferase [Pantoea sp. SS70]WGK55940.1 class I SAM-dependent methyltransferase [Pantoea sp. SS70]
MSNNFYRKFEDKHRGSTDEIRQRLLVYLPLMTSLHEFYPDSVVADIGCGRGEWLKLLRDNEIQGIGVDLDEGMLAVARKDGLNIEQDDCINFLKRQTDDSLMAITGFHIVEHLPFNIVHTLVSEALRVLKPGGLLILETPNPENVSVGSCSFYMDPTHHNPLPPELLKFLPDYYGFKRTRIVRLQESPRIRSEETEVALTEVLKGVSPDYSIVAQKAGHNNLHSQLNKFFVKKIGVTLDELADRYDASLNLKFERISSNYSAELELIHEKINSFSQVNKKLAETNAELAINNSELNQQLSAVYLSSSWRVTSPIRRVVDILKRINAARKKGFKYLASALMKKVLNRLIILMGKNPGYRTKILLMMRKVGIYSAIRKIYLNTISSEKKSKIYDHSIAEKNHNNMTGRAVEIFEELKSHEDQVNKGDR